MSREVVDAYYAIKDQIYHSMTCGIPDYDCNCGVEAFRSAIAGLQEMKVPEGIYYSKEHQNFYSIETRLGQGLQFWNAWRQYAKHFPQE